eukprot:199387-Chlamydomonas_euryale.AAC.2
MSWGACRQKNVEKRCGGMLQGGGGREVLEESLYGGCPAGVGGCSEGAAGCSEGIGGALRAWVGALRA